MTLPEAEDLCILAHTGQTRRDGSPYHTHPIAVASMMTTDEEKIVALLHDVIEDTSAELSDWSAEGYAIIFAGKKYHISIEVAYALKLLTHDLHMFYEVYIDNITANKLATKVKIADITCNLSDNPTNKQKEKYFKALTVLLNSL